jgi:Ni,Fe-hydrogenase I cytochrome b subunit
MKFIFSSLENTEKENLFILKTKYFSGYIRLLISHHLNLKAIRIMIGTGLWIGMRSP